MQPIKSSSIHNMPASKYGSTLIVGQALLRPKSPVSLEMARIVRAKCKMRFIALLSNLPVVDQTQPAEFPFAFSAYISLTVSFCSSILDTLNLQVIWSQPPFFSILAWHWGQLFDKIWIAAAEATSFAFSMAFRFLNCWQVSLSCHGSSQRMQVR